MKILHEERETYAPDVFVRSNNPNAYRSEQWARVLYLFWHVPRTPDGGPARLCMKVEFVDGAKDEWVVFDAAAEYEFSNRAGRADP